MVEISREEIDRFLMEQTIGRVGYQLAGATHIVPLIYAYQHGAIYILTVEGQKTRALRDNPAVCFEIDEYDSATGSWRSVIIHGTFEELTGAESEEAFRALRARHGGRRQSPDASREPQERPRPTVAFRIRINSATGRALTRVSTPQGFARP